MLKTEKLDELFPLLEKMTRTTIGDPKLAPRLLIFMRGLLWFSGIGLSVIWLAIFWLRYGTTPPEFPDADLITVIFLVLFFVFMLTLIAKLLCDLWPPKQFVPYIELSREDTMRRDAQLITELLLKFDRATLAYGLLQYRHRWSSLEDRATALVGDFRKFGLIPALAAIFISVATLKEDNNQFLWVGLVVIVVAFNLMGLAALLLRQRQRQVIQLLEYAIQHADQCNITPSDTITSTSSGVLA